MCVHMPPVTAPSMKCNTDRRISFCSDNCRCAQCVNQDTLQRNFDTFAVSIGQSHYCSQYRRMLISLCLQIPKDVSPTEISPKSDGVDILCTHYSKLFCLNIYEMKLIDKCQGRILIKATTHGPGSTLLFRIRVIRSPRFKSK